MINNIVINGHLGSKNLGDELMLAGLLKGLENSNVTVIAENTDNIGNIQFVQDFKVVKRSLWVLFKEIIRADELIMCGGSNFSDLINTRKYQFIMFYWLSQFTLAKLFGVKTRAEGIEIGPIKSKFSAFLLKCISLVSNNISLRDTDSLKLSNKLGLAKNCEISLTKDLAYKYLDNIQLNNTSNLISYGVISLLDYKLLYGQAVNINSLKNYAKIFFSNTKKLVVLAIDGENDANFTKEIAKSLGLNISILVYDGSNLLECISMIKNASKVMCMRYHGILITNYYNIELLGIAYHPKINRYAKDKHFKGTLLQINQII